MMTILKTTNNGDFDDVNVRRILTLDKYHDVFISLGLLQLDSASVGTLRSV